MREFLLLLIFLIVNKTYGQMSSNIIIGKIIDTEGEYVFINTESDKEATKGMVFGIYNTENDAIGICEISKIIRNGNYIAHVLTQTDEIKNDYTALADIEKEHKLREKIKDLKVSARYLDSYKKFEDSLNNPIDKTNFDIIIIKDKILRNIFFQSMQYIDIHVHKFSNPEEIPPNIYKVIDESGILKIDEISDKTTAEATINIGKLKKLLQNKGYALKPKIINLIFPTDNNPEIIEQVIDKILKYSNYIAKENEDIHDVTNPVSCIIYATPQTFADEIDTFDFEGIGISVLKVYGDTIEFKIW